MKRLIFSSIAVIALVFSTSGHMTAQELTDYEGVESAYIRSYYPESAPTTDSVAAASTSAESTPEATADDGAFEYRSANVIGITFDSEENAEAFLGSMRESIEQSIDESETESEAEIADLDGDLDGFSASMKIDGYGVNAIAVVLDGTQVFLVDVTDEDNDSATSLVNNIVNHVSESGSETDEVAFNEDGSSTGGVFDRMPEAGSDAVDGLDFVSDEDLMAA